MKKKQQKPRYSQHRTDDPTGYGRIVRNETGLVEKIVEHKDASEEERRLMKLIQERIALIIKHYLKH